MAIRTIKVRVNQAVTKINKLHNAFKAVNPNSNDVMSCRVKAEKEILETLITEIDRLECIISEKDERLSVQHSKLHPILSDSIKEGT